MSKRPVINLSDLTSEAATPMPEASQRHAQAVPVPAPPASPGPRPAPLARNHATEEMRTENLQGLAFKVPLSFRRRFRQRAADADLKLNELLFQALDAWEAMKGLKK